ncbi:hypothetical protein [Xanthomonas translucens]|uniref:hypothetical protein n=1 Tax=Xanthomonas campestris pv. translucens TaxID=343 RepID=UPI0012D89065|nr:hypothetical protein [Xanthomonas translucens]MCT8271643.1 hypothetical protein [Xanthomonas translucens pv. undulosa]WNJ32431.1 hypothetical protein RMA82_08775 [Xanthomonas translucens pv. undulosa]
MSRLLQGMLQPADTIAQAQRLLASPRLAEVALRGEDVGSSVGGEQPKFAATL